MWNWKLYISLKAVSGMMEVWKHHQWCSLNMWCLMLFGGRAKEQISVLAHQDIIYISVQNHANISAKTVENKTVHGWEGWWWWKACKILKRNHLLTFSKHHISFSRSSAQTRFIWSKGGESQDRLFDAYFSSSF